MSIDLNDFTPISAVFELRYAPQFLIWDRSGALWTRIAGTFPAIAVKEAEPNKVLVRLEENVDAAVGAERTIFTVRKPNSGFDRLKAVAGAVVPAMIDLFEIDQFTRFGLRLVFGKRFPDRYAAADYLKARVPVPQPPGRSNNIIAVDFRRNRSLDPTDPDEAGFVTTVTPKVSEEPRSTRKPTKLDDTVPGGGEARVGQVRGPAGGAHQAHPGREVARRPVIPAMGSSGRCEPQGEQRSDPGPREFDSLMEVPDSFGLRPQLPG
jgi:hypothetical protein